MVWRKDDLEARLTPDDRRRIFKELGFYFNGHRAGSEGWINGVLGPKPLGEGEHANFAANIVTGAVKDHGSSGYSGSLYDAVMDAKGLTFPEALDWIADVLGLPEPLERSRTEPADSTDQNTKSAQFEGIKKSTPAPNEPEPVASLDAVKQWAEAMQSDRPEAIAARSYLTGRGLSEGIIRELNIGLSRKTGRRSNVRVEWWIVIPIWSRVHFDGKDPIITAVKGFAFDPEAKDWKRTPNGRKIARNASSALYDLTTSEDLPVLICEGELDAVCATAHGFNAVSGTNGAATFKAEWARYLARYVAPASEHGVIVCFDGDEAGRTHAPSAAQTLYEAGLSVRIASLPDGQDVSDVLLQDGSEALTALVESAEPHRPQAYSEDANAKTLNESAHERGTGSDIPYEPFPIDTLPGPVRDYVVAASKALPAPPAMVAVPTLSVIAGAIGSAARIHLKDSWHEPATLWTVLVAPSGSTKSPAFNHAVRPIYARETEAHDRYKRKMAEWKADGEEGEAPVRRRYRTGDATPEAIVKILSNNPRGVLLARDELGAWIGSFDRYVNGAADLQFWIEIWQGIQASRDRAGEGNVTVDRPTVSVTGTIQPGTLKDKLDEIHFDTGFASRLILCQPPPKPKRWTEADVSRSVRDGYDHLLTRLYDTAPGTTLSLSRDAKELWIGYYNEANASLETRPEGPAKAVAAKGITHTARMALLVHLCRKAAGESCSDDIDRESMEAALDVGQWLTEETLRVYDRLALDCEAVPPIRRFLNALPNEFQTVEARSIAQRREIPRRTLFEWLSKLQESGNLEKIKRGLYRKT